MDQQVSPPPAARGSRDLEDLVGRRLLGWAGAGAIAVGLAFLVAVAVDRGLLGPSARVALASAASGLLVGVGGWLYERHGRTQAALAAVGTGVCGGYLALVGATKLYDLIPTTAGLAAAAAIGLFTVPLALHWNSRTLVALAIGGGLLAPLMVGADPGGLTIAFELTVLASAVALLLWRRWEWLSVGCFALTAPQVMAWTATHPSPSATIVALSAYCGLIAIAALGYELRVPAARLRASTTGLLVGGALVSAGCGYWALRYSDADAMASAWLAALAIVHIALGALALRSTRLRDEIGVVGLAAGMTLADAAFASVGSGPLLTIGWALSATGLAVVARRADRHADGARLALSAQLSLAAIHTITVDAPPDAVLGNGDTTGALVALCALGAGAFTSARLQRSAALGGALDVVAMMALLVATVTALDGAALVASWAAAAAIIGRLGRRDPVALAGQAGFLALAGVYTVTLAPASALTYGVDSLPDVVLALGSIAAALFAIRLPKEIADWRPFVRTAGATVLLYLASIAVVDATVHEQGQVLLSTLWALVGAVALIVGLGRDARLPRLAGLALLAIAGTKVFVVDLAELDSIYRVLSCVGLGALLLGSAFAYQRLRPALSR